MECKGEDSKVTMEATTSKITIKVKNEEITGKYDLEVVKVDESGNEITSSEATFTINNAAKETIQGKIIMTILDV